jgi:hypothetical protein
LHSRLWTRVQPAAETARIRGGLRKAPACPPGLGPVQSKNSGPRTRGQAGQAKSDQHNSMDMAEPKLGEEQPAGEAGATRGAEWQRQPRSFYLRMSRCPLQQPELQDVAQALLHHTPPRLCRTCCSHQVPCCQQNRDPGRREPLEMRQTRAWSMAPRRKRSCGGQSLLSAVMVTSIVKVHSGSVSQLGSLCVVWCPSH